MHILISNDDGIQAPGISRLRLALEEIALVYVAAPDRERSATGHQITMHRPLQAKKVPYSNSESIGWAINGTPADCVSLAMHELLPVRPDLVIAGINQGPNLGTDVLYSGTVSAAMEASIGGYPAIAISLASYETPDFTAAGDFIKKFVTNYGKSLPQKTLLNINVPAATPKGVRITRLGVREYRNVFSKRVNPRGDTYYWMAGECFDVDGDEQDTDTWAVNNDYISITPLQFDLTNYQGLSDSRKIFKDLTRL
ncbi:MAG: 5'/3'-nucleotidase SurE [Peptococcaceae bacterium]|nr:5'/3'-nucleotidase SurE [Peptococcaceae bacterium]